MGLQLRIVAGPDEGKTFALTPGETFQIGRGMDTQTRLHDPRVSRNHCSIEVTGDEATLIDAGSTGGTFINGQRVSERLLRSGDIIRVGGTQLQFVGTEGDTLSWSGERSRPTSDLMETREMKKVAVEPSESDPRSIVSEPMDDDETVPDATAE
jgi:pSer/pThr/pTyr-binding forkhead associated (FHA) protein